MPKETVKEESKKSNAARNILLLLLLLLLIVFVIWYLTRPVAQPAQPAPAPAATVTAPIAPPTPPALPPAPPAATPKPINLNASVFFAFDKSAIGDTTPLKVIAEAAKTQKIERITVSGFTDRIGSKEHNQRLSDARAAAVRDFLVGAGVNGSLIVASGKGALVSPDCKQRSCLEQDRRADVELVGLSQIERN